MNDLYKYRKKEIEDVVMRQSISQMLLTTMLKSHEGASSDRLALSLAPSGASIDNGLGLTWGVDLGS